MPADNCVLGEGEAAVQVTKVSDGIQFRKQIGDMTFFCKVPGHEWFEAWKQLKDVRNGDVQQWSYIDEVNKTMLVIETCIEIVKNVHQIQFIPNIVPIRHSKSFQNMKKISEAKS